ncbi:MAG: hypothetical protein K0R38_239 [Polyangiaceae bacterium]|nr:hypothetical protein [Polyangiaceae bacterium]
MDAPPSAEALAEARHVLGRFSFGPRPGEVERVARMGHARWLAAQLAGPEESPLLEAALVPHRAAYAPPKQLVEDWLGEDWEESARTDRELRRETRPYFKEHLQRLATAELTRDILSRRQLEAVMTDFWANHFNVFAGKGFVRLFEGDYLERAIRPHALGKFSDLLLATARHPAMLLYLDNAQSRKESRKVRQGKARRGLNENYARELLELHTLGVDGGYTQEDVQSVARILTGWSVVRLSEGEGDFQFVFRKSAHDRGEKKALGEVFPAGEGESEGRRLLELLARHPSTARHVARRLCIRFVADEPPASCVHAASRAYTQTEGDIRAVVRAISEDASFWSPAARGVKLKTPLELVASAARALGAHPDGSLVLSKTLERLGEPLLQERVPTGYPDSEPEWASGGGMLARLKFASDLGAGQLRGLSVPWEETLPLGPELTASLARFGSSVLGLPESSRTLRLVQEEVSTLSEPEQRRAAAVALILGSPEFQRQ